LRHVVTFFAILILAGAAAWYSLSPKYPVALGLDLKGGMRVTLEPDDTKEDGRNIDADKMGRVRDVLENRVNSFGLSGTDVRLQTTGAGKQQVLVVLPGARNPEEALKQLQTVAQMEFRHLNQVNTRNSSNRRYKMDIIPGDAAKGEPDTYKFIDNRTGKEVPQAEVLRESPLILKGDWLLPNSKPEINPQSGEPYVTFEFNSEGAKRFGEFTGNNRSEHLAIVLDNNIISAPVINDRIEGSGQISGGFKNMAEARLLANLLNSGALPVPLRPAETQYVGATLGQESIDKSIQAGLMGLALVLAFMLLYYWLPGLLACIALLFYAALTFALFKGAGIFPPIVLDLPGITGFILSVGMAVDANILIFERLKEELKAGKSLTAAIDAGFSRAFSSIFDSNVTTWIVCAILIWLGAPIIKGFAITLAIGVAVSMFTAITVTRTLLHLVILMPWARNPALYGLNVSWLGMIFPASRRGAILRVFEKRKIYFGVSILMAVISLVFLAGTPFGMGLKPGIDFTGGTVVEAPFYPEANKPVAREQVLGALQAAGVQDATVAIGRSERPWTVVNIEATGVDQVAESKIRQRLGNADIVRGFVDKRYTTSRDKDTFKATAVYAIPVKDADVRTALQTPGGPGDVGRLDLKNLKVASTTEPHTGANAIPVALIQSQKILPGQLVPLKEKLNELGGGIIQPMYSENSIGPSVAAQVTLNAFWSVLVASLAIILYLAFRFAIGGFLNGLKFGACAVIALAHDVGIVLGIFALMGFLAGWHVDSLFVTAALTILGFSVHDTIVVYDRVRENLMHRLKGETFADVSDRSITQTFDRSLNTSVTVLLAIAALVIFGGETIRQFNLALLIGIGIGAYSSIFVASPLVVLLERATSGARAGARQQAAPSGRPGRRDEPTSGRPARETSRPTATVASRGGAETGSTETGAAPAADAARAKSGTVRPKKKRRL
jgi:protein-export membrane protein SecD/preprotein translocase SecF subunit